MKSTIKRMLFAGIALSLAALTARRCERELQIEGNLDPSQPEKPSLPPNSGGKGQTGPLPSVSGGSGRTAPLSEAPAGVTAGPLPYSPSVSVTFSGTLVRKGSRLALREIAGSLYPLDGATNASSFEGTDVRITGKIDLSTRLLHVDAIERATL